VKPGKKKNIIIHLGDEQYARWWQQFRDIVLPHRHEQQSFLSTLSIFHGSFSIPDSQVKFQLPRFITAYSKQTEVHYAATSSALICLQTVVKVKLALK
jgi:hypothetical protein